jgi:hypothetical protein
MLFYRNAIFFYLQMLVFSCVICKILQGIRKSVELHNSIIQVRNTSREIRNMKNKHAKKRVFPLKFKFKQLMKIEMNGFRRTTVLHVAYMH